MSAPLFEKLKEMKCKNNYPLHMPGHKRNELFFAPDVFNLDFTEVGENDNLHYPNGVILQAENEFARFMQCDFCKMLVNGGSSGVMSAVVSAVHDGDMVLTASNCHKSVSNALVITGAVPVYITPQISKYGFAEYITPSAVQAAFDKYPQIKAVVITSPTYEGIVSDITEISRITHKYGALLIVDETHGAHFPFHDKFPQPAIRQGADITVESWHKTLPSFNQSALLCANAQNADIKRLREAFSLVTTTSPSYILMAQMDYMRDMLTKNKHIFNDYVSFISDIRSRLSGCRCIQLLNFENGDISKLVFALNTDQSGVQTADIFRRNGFECELAAPHHIIAMTSIADDKHMIEKFAQLVTETDKSLKYADIKSGFDDDMPPGSLTVPELTPRRAFYAQSKKYPLAKAAGKIAAAAAVPYPPDVPVIQAGEKITEQKIKLVEKYISAGVDVIGVEDGCLSVVSD